MGVCHIAEFQPWPGYARKGETRNSSNSSRSEAVGPGRSKQSKSGIALVNAAPVIALGQAHRNPARISQPGQSAPAQVAQPGPEVSPSEPPRSHNFRERSAPEGPRGPGSRLAQASSGPPLSSSFNDIGDDRFDKLEQAISWWVDQGEAPAKGAGRSSTSALLCGRIPQQIADLRSHTRKLAAHCDSLQVTTNHGHPLAHDSSSGPSLEHMEATHFSVMDIARRLLEAEGGAMDMPGTMEPAQYAAGQDLPPMFAL